MDTSKLDVRTLRYEFNKTEDYFIGLTNFMNAFFSVTNIRPIKVPNQDQSLEIHDFIGTEFTLRLSSSGKNHILSVKFINGWMWTLSESKSSNIPDLSEQCISELIEWTAKLDGTKVSSEKFKIFSSSGSSTYDVDMSAYTCTCPNFRYRCIHHPIDREERLCKHMLEVLDSYPELSPKKVVSQISDGKDPDGKTRFPREVFDIYVSDLRSALNSFKDIIEKWQVCGSYRRLAKTVSDLDILIQLKPNCSWDRLLDYLESSMNYQLITNIGRGDKKAAYMVDGFIHIDFKNVQKENWPFALMHFTGSKSTNIEMRRRANSMGYTLNEYGLFRLSNETPVEGLETEEDIYKFLEVKYQQPWER